MKKYRVTKRGKIVFPIVVVIFFMSGYSLIDNLGTQKNIENISEEQNNVVSISTESNLEKPALEDEIKNDLKNMEYSTSDVENLQKACFSIFYSPNKYLVSKEYLSKLLKFSDVAKKYVNEEIVIEGNANLVNENVDELDSILRAKAGYERALVIKNYLIENEIAEDRITIINNGGDKSLNIDNSAESLLLNRRSDVYFTEYNNLNFNFK